MVARLDLIKAFRRRPVISILTGEVMETLDQAYTSFSSILVTFSDSEKLFILHIANTIYITYNDL